MIEKIRNASGIVRVLIGCLCCTIVIFISSFFYYGNINSAEDPRTLPAKNLLLQYEKQLNEDQSEEALDILNSIVQMYKEVPGYGNSYEVGVIYNNIASVYLVQLETELLTKDNLTKEDLVMNLDLATQYCQKSIENYELWLKEMKELSTSQIKEKIAPFFDPKDPAFKEVDFEAVFEKRVADIQLAQIETTRRLSVALTNLGVINRYQGNFEQAKANYKKAIELWDRNYTAQDNLNTLLNQPIKKRSMIDKLFPPEKNKEST